MLFLCGKNTCLYEIMEAHALQSTKEDLPNLVEDLTSKLFEPNK